MGWMDEQAGVQIDVFEIMPAAVRIVGQKLFEARVLSFIQRAIAKLGKQLLQFEADLRRHETSQSAAKPTKNC